MITRPTHHRAGLAAVVLVVAGGLVAGGAVGATSESDSDTTIPGDEPPVGETVRVEVTDDGDPANRVSLNTPPAQGDAARETIELRGELRGTTTPSELGGESSVPIETNAAGLLEFNCATAEARERDVVVDAVQPEGGYVATVTLESYENDSECDAGSTETVALPGLFSSESDPSALIGVPTTYVFEAGGEVVEATAASDAPLTPEQESALDSETDNLALLALLVPDVPVGEGATWTVTSSEAPIGDIAPLEFELVSLDGDEFEVEISTGEIDLAELLAAAAEDSSDPEAMTELFSGTGTLAVTGEIAGTVGDPMGHRAIVRIDFDVTMTIFDQTVTMVGYFELERTATATTD